jgi:hypothetical protein
MAMSEREFPYEFSANLGALAKALAAAQGELQDAKKDSVNPHFKNRFASLSSVRSAITPTFVKHGLAVTQLNEPHGEKGVCVVTMLLHESGEWLRSKLFVPVTKSDPQGFGSALSYARRYALASLANIATEDDDDGEQAVSPKREMYANKPGEKPPAGLSANDTATVPVDVAALVKALEDSKNAEELSRASVKVGSVRKQLSAKDYDLLRAAHDNTLRRLEAAS